MIMYNIMAGILSSALSKKTIYRFFETIFHVSAIPLILTMTTIFLTFLYHHYKNRNVPPGPWGLPYVGYWPFLDLDTVHLQLEQMKKKYGDVFSFTVTGRLFIHLGTTRAIKEAHISKAECFRKRYSDFNMLKRVFGESVVCQNGESWKVLRKFFMQLFKEYGMTALKDPDSDPILDAVAGTVDYLQALKGESVNIVSLLVVNISEMVRQLLFKDEGMTPEDMFYINRAYENVQLCFVGPRPLLMGKFAKYVIFPLTPGYNNAMENHKYIVDVTRKVIKRHEETFDENNIRNSIDYYLKERNERRRKEDPSAEYFSEDALLYSLIQFTGDGVLDLALFVAYFIKALVDHPEEQEKIYQELKEVVGSGRDPVYEDKARLPYTNAFMLEVIRTSDFFTIFPSLECTKETTLDGYKIPEGSITLMNMWAAQYDSNTYEEPTKFDPSRYLVENEDKRPELPVIFGIGKRACSGEAFVMIIGFLFVATIVNNFELLPFEDSPKDSIQDRELNICVREREVKETDK